MECRFLIEWIAIHHKILKFITCSFNNLKSDIHVKFDVNYIFLKERDNMNVLLSPLRICNSGITVKVFWNFMMAGLTAVVRRSWSN